MNGTSRWRIQYTVDTLIPNFPIGFRAGAQTVVIALFTSITDQRLRFLGLVRVWIRRGKGGGLEGVRRLTEPEVHGQDGDLDGGDQDVVGELDGEDDLEQVYHVIQREEHQAEPGVVLPQDHDLGAVPSVPGTEYLEFGG